MRPRVVVVVWAAGGLLLAGCHAPAPGSASVYVKDAPTDEFDEIHIIFTQVEVHFAASAEADDNTSSAGWTVLFHNESGLDVELLATAASDVAALLGEAALAAGQYTQIRVYADGAYGIQDDARVDFDLPDRTLRVVKGFNVSADMETRIVIDLDLDRSLKENPHGWRLSPVVGKTSVKQVNDTRSGSDADTPGEPTQL